MSLDEAIAKIEQLEQKLTDDLQAISEESAMNSMSLIINRIQQEGLPGKKYSTNKLPEYFFEGRELNAGGRQLISKRKKAKKEDRGISYKEWREANGLQTAIVDLTYSGRMMQNIGIIKTEKSGDVIVTTIGGLDKEVQDKLMWNARRFGDFFVVNDQEKAEIESVTKKRIQNLINSIII